MNYKDLSDLLFPNVEHDYKYYLNKFKPRNLAPGALVTRFAPSPTGSVHMGSLLTAFYGYILAKQTNGVFFLRIEDTDQERSIENGISGILSDLELFDIVANEGVDKNQADIGEYGPYIQSRRKDIYIAFAKKLVEDGLAYPCFCSKEELGKIREVQEKNKEVQIGYYGDYAKCRNLSLEQVKQNIESGKKFVIRFKASGKVGDRIKFADKLRGEIEMPKLINDVVILKSETMLPPYNFAHVVDDTLMGTNLVIRSNEWLNSTPEHLAIFEALGFKSIDYAHVAFVQKIDPETGAKRKISKRLDPESAVLTIYQKGYVIEAVWEYLYTLANTNFEEWRLQNPNSALSEFKIDIKKISLSGALFDIDKLNDISKNVISKFRATNLFDKALDWANQFDKEFAIQLVTHKDLLTAFLNIDRENAKPRKDIVCLSDIKNYVGYILNDYFNLSTTYELVGDFKTKTYKQIFDCFFATYNADDLKEVWFSKIKDFCAECGFTSDVKEYKKNPENYLGHIGTVCSIIRVALTGKQNTPDLYEICKLLGKNKMEERCLRFLDLNS